MSGDPADRVERAQILERTEVAGARRYEVSPYCWIGSIAVVTLTIVGLLAVDAVGLARLDSVLGELKSQTADLDVLHKSGSCVVSTTGALMNTFSFFKEDILSIKNYVEVQAEQQRMDIAQVYVRETSNGINIEVPAHIKCLPWENPNLDETSDDDGLAEIDNSLSYDEAPQIATQIEPFCASIQVENECTGTSPTAIVSERWLALIARHRLAKIEMLLIHATDSSCQVMQSEYTWFYENLKKHMVNPCIWVASGSETRG